jgi:hypothetical protein
MADNKENNVVHIDPVYIKYRKMWKENRWQFSGDLVRLTIKQSKGDLDNIEMHTLRTMNRVIGENDGKWTDGYEWNEGVLTKRPKKK